MGSLDTRHINLSDLPPEQNEGQKQRTPPGDAGTRRYDVPAQQQTQLPEGRRLPDGHLLQGRYRILGVRAIGGMSSVYKAQDLRFSNVTRLCAVKEMLNTANDPEVRAVIVKNFEREANILATLSHPGIVQVYDFFSEGDRSYLVLEYVDGKDLGTILEESRDFLPEEQVVRWAIQICDVLNYLHDHEPQPIVFRDIKPPNVMLDKHNRIRLVDFGIAKMFQSGQKGTMIGTEGYAPPEQYRGISDPRVDVYALGATMHHLLSRQDPRQEPPFSFHERPIHKSNPNVSMELVEIVNRALEYNPDDRYDSIRELQQALAQLRSARSLGSVESFQSAPSISTGGDIMELWRFACEDEIRSAPTVHHDTVYVSAYDHNLYAITVDTGKFRWKCASEGGMASSPYVHEGRVFVGSADHKLYAINAVSGRVSWTCATEGKVWSSPKVAFGHVFIGSDDRHLYAISVYSGRVAWAFNADGMVRSSPSIDEDAIYVGCEAGSVYAIETSSKLRWRFSARRGVTSSPALTEEMLYVGSHDRHVYGLDIRSGWSVWRFRTEGPIISSPAVSEGLVYIGSADGHLYALDAGDGYLAWRFGTDDQVVSSPVFYEGAVYFGSIDGKVYSLDAKNGDLRWSFQTEGPVIGSPTVVDSVVYVGSSDHNLYALPA